MKRVNESAKTWVLGLIVLVLVLGIAGQMAQSPYSVSRAGANPLYVEPTYDPRTTTPTAIPSSTPTSVPTGAPTATPAGSSQPRAEVSVFCMNCWDSQAVLWVGGTEKPALSFEPNHAGAPAVHWTLWNKDPWTLRVKAALPDGLDPNRWKLILWTGTGPDDYAWTDEVTFTVWPGGSAQVNFQLVDTAFWQ